MATALMRTLPVRSHFDASLIVQTANNAAVTGESYINQNYLHQSDAQGNNDNNGGSDSQENKEVNRRRWRPHRDSLARRRKHGKVGSRRHRRYLNNLYLNDVNYWDGEFEDIMAVQDMMTWCPEYTSAFQELLEDDSALEVWDDFRFVTEQKQDDLLLKICGEEPVAPHSKRLIFEDPSCEEATQQFLQIQKETRQLLKHSYNIRLIQAIELKLLPLFMDDCGIDTERFASFEDSLKNDLSVYFSEWSKKNTNRNNAVILMKSSRDRKVIHGVCMFYGLLSKSQACRSGHRTTVVSKSKHFSPILGSSMLLSAYLQVLLSDHS